MHTRHDVISLNLEVVVRPISFVDYQAPNLHQKSVRADARPTLRCANNPAPRVLSGLSLLPGPPTISPVPTRQHSAHSGRCTDCPTFYLARTKLQHGGQEFHPGPSTTISFMLLGVCTASNSISALKVPPTWWHRWRNEAAGCTGSRTSQCGPCRAHWT